MGQMNGFIVVVRMSESYLSQVAVDTRESELMLRHIDGGGGGGGDCC